MALWAIYTGLIGFAVGLGWFGLNRFRARVLT